jgi:hypothetical protein
MYESMETKTELTSVIEGIEGQLEKTLTVQKETIEKTLLERVTREKEEAQKKIEATEREFAEGRRLLEEHKSVLADLKTAKDQIQGQIRGHLERAQSNQKMMEKMSSQALDEYDKISHLGLELDGIRQRAEEESNNLRRQLEQKFGIRVELKAVFESGEIMSDLRLEIQRLKKIKELLSAGKPIQIPEAEAPAVQEEPPPAAEETPAESQPAAPPEPPDSPEPPMRSQLRGYMDSLAAEEPAAAAEETPTEEFAASDSNWGVPSDDAEPDDVSGLMEALAQYRKIEPVLNGTEFAYFKKDKKMVLDSEAFMTTVGKISDVAKGLHMNLGQKEMSKDMFLLKQEILNQQEILRKAFLRVVRFCEKEDGTIPQYVADVLSVRGMKDILERLTFGNWSNPADFSSFIEHVGVLKHGFLAKITPLGNYLRAVLAQVEGRTADAN